MTENIYNYYCDESCHLQNDMKQYMVLGYISAPYTRIKKIKDEIKEIRKKHKNSIEVKWSNLNNWNYPFYSDLANFFLDRIDINFRAIIVDKQKYIAAKCDYDYDKFYYKMYYQLLIHKVDAENRYNIYIDIKDDLSNYRIEKLKEILNVQGGIIEKIQHVRSHEVDLLQICDLLIGATSYKLNNQDQTSTPKLKLIEKIEKRLGFSITEQTYKNETKYNIFKIRL